VYVLPCDPNDPAETVVLGPNGQIELGGGQCLDVPGALAADHNLLQAFPCSGGTNQQFQWSPNGSLTVLGKCVDLPSANTLPGSPLQIFSCTNGAVNQQFEVTLPVVVESVNTGGAFCSGPNVSTCSVPGGGLLAYDGTAGNVITAAQRAATPNASPPFPPFQFQTWQEVLALLYAGYVDPALHPGDPETGKNCASSLRWVLANQYGNLFEAPLCTFGTSCGQLPLQHVFRLDDGKDTSVLFAQVLGVPTPVVNQNPVPLNLGNFSLGSDPFCNDLANNTLVGGMINGVPAASDANPAWGTLWPGSNPPTAIPNDDQDFDPIRRLCAGTAFNSLKGEQVCERATFDVIHPTCTGTGLGTCPSSYYFPFGNSEYCLGGQCWDLEGTLGLVLPIITTTTIGTDAVNPHLNDQYNVVTTPGTPATTNPCCTNLETINKCVSVTQVNTISVPNGHSQPLAGLCPNGDESQTAGGTCWTPVDANGNPNCWTTAPPQLCNGADCTQGAINRFGTTTGGGPDVRTIDSRVYNLYSYTFLAGAWQPNVDDYGRPVTGAFYRIHTSQSMLPTALGSCSATKPGTPVCAMADPSEQIGCLVQASPCSIGYSNLAGATAFGTTNVISGGFSVAECLQSDTWSRFTSQGLAPLCAGYPF
jgi:hypothetical protein